MSRTRPLTKVGLALAALLATLVALPIGASAHSPDRDDRSGGEATYTVHVRNLTGGQPLTPPNWAAHSRSADVFQIGRPASNGLQQVAENGGVPVLAAELQAAVDDQGLGVSGVGADGPILPGDRISFDITTDADRFSLVAMLVCTNDGFAGLDAKRLPTRAGQTRHYVVGAYDAGTEINTELRRDLVPEPPCGEGPGSTMSDPALAENGVVRRHRTLRGVGDLDPALDWRGPVALVTITRR
jgi:hypothetical protein